MAIRKSSGSGIPSGLTAGRPANPGFGQLYSNGEANRLELYTQASGWQNIIQEVPGVASITGNYSEATNSGTITIAGTNFVAGAIASAIGTNGVEVQAQSTTYNSLVQLTAVFANLVNANEPYDIKVINPSNLFGMIPDALYVNASPVWVTSSGSLGTFTEQVSITLSALSSTDSDSTVTYALASGSSLPSGVTLNSSTGVISGTLPNISSQTTYTFTINATDGVNAIPRSFSILSNVNQLPAWSTTSGTLATIYDLSRTNYSVSATASDNESDTLAYSLVSGTLPPSMTLNTSTGAISGTTTSVGTDTTYSFVLGVSDGVTGNSVVTRSFDIIVKAPFTQTLSGSGTITTLPTATITLEMLGGGGGGGTGNSAWAGGGGGGGYLVARYNTVSGSSYSYSVGSAGPGQTACNNSSHTTIGKGGNSTFGTLIAAGGNGGNFIGGGGGEGGTNTTTGAVSVIKNYSGQNGAAISGGDAGANGGSNGLYNGESISTYGSGTGGVGNSLPGPHASGNGNGGAGGASCQTPTRGGGNGSAGIIKISY
jgi:hypothetical protein